MFGLQKLFAAKNEKYDPVGSAVLRDYNNIRTVGENKRLCYAPFKSIYFGHHGRAIACCYNRTHILGQYPKQSIKEIWFGESANQLRDYIKHNDLSLGCLSCKQQLVAGNFDAVKAKQYDERKMNANKYPSVMEFELSNVCNLECEMCSGDYSSLIRSKREKLPPLEIPYDSNFVKQLEEFIPYLEEVKFYGGEPFLIDIYYEIWEKIMEINPSVRISIQTNGTTLNNRVKRILENTNFHMNISFDSLEKENYERIRKNAEFGRTMENIKWFREYSLRRNTFFGISVCAMQQNWHELPNFITFCNEMEAPVYIHTVFLPHHCAIRTLDAVKLGEIVQYLEKFDFPQNTAVQKKNRTHYLDLIKQVRSWYEAASRLHRVRSISTFADLEQLLVNHITNDKALEESIKADRIKKVKQKINLLEQQQQNISLSKIAPLLVPNTDPNGPSLFDSMVYSLIQFNPDDLTKLAKEKLQLNEGWVN